MSAVLTCGMPGASAFAQPDGVPQATAPVSDDRIFGYLLFDQLEYRRHQGEDALGWEVDGWLGTDYDRLAFRTEGNQRVEGDGGGDVELQFLYSRLVAPFWFFQVGGRFDQLHGAGPDRSRVFGVVGFEGVAPYRFDVQPALYVSEEGDVSARLEATYELLLTQRLIAQPRLEVDVAAQEVERFGVGAGFNDVELGLRVRYEIRREFAPYIGFSWRRLVGDTADLAGEGDQVDDLFFVAGIRLWF